MQNSKKTVENYKALKIQQKTQQKTQPQAHIYTNIKKLGVDLEKLARTNPYLYTTFTRIFSGIATPQTLTLWDNLQKAYKELEEQGMLNFENVRETIMRKKMVDFSKKVNGPCLIPLDELLEVVTEKKRKKVVSIEVDFNDYMDLLEKHYKFQHRDFFQRFGKEPINFAKILGMTKKEYKEYSKLNANENYNAAKLSVITQVYNNMNEMPYADFWHYLMDNEFMEVSNGCIMSMYSEAEDDEHEDSKTQDYRYIVEKDGVIATHYLFNDMRQVIFKEMSQHPSFKGETPEEINFYIGW